VIHPLGFEGLVRGASRFDGKHGNELNVWNTKPMVLRQRAIAPSRREGLADISRQRWGGPWS
jgi:hypothetical protein